MVSKHCFEIQTSPERASVEHITCDILLMYFTFAYLQCRAGCNSITFKWSGKVRFVEEPVIQFVLILEFKDYGEVGETWINCDQCTVISSGEIVRNID